MAQKPTTSSSGPPKTPKKLDAEIGYSTVPVPSRGRLYAGDALPGGLVKMRKMLSGDMARLQSQGGNPLARIEAVVNACTKLPEGFSSKDLLLGDSFFLMLALRTMSFGTSYTYTWRCRYCSAIDRATMDIVDDLEENIADEDLEEPLPVTLVDAGVTVGCRFLRVSDQDQIAKHAKRTKLQSSDVTDPSFTYRLALMLVDKDGMAFSTILEKQDFIRSLSAADTLRFDRAISDKEPSVDLRVYPCCASCGADNEITLPFDADFFRPSDL